MREPRRALLCAGRARPRGGVWSHTGVREGAAVVNQSEPGAGHANASRADAGLSFAWPQQCLMHASGNR